MMQVDGASADWFAQAVLRLRAGDFVEARRLLSEVIRVQPACAPAHAYLGLACLQLSDVASAKWHLDRAVEGDPEEFLAWAKRGELWFRLACYPQAVADLRRALTLAAPTAASRRWTAKLLEEAQHRARGSFTRSIAWPHVGALGALGCEPGPPRGRLRSVAWLHWGAFTARLRRWLTRRGGAGHRAPAAGERPGRTGQLVGAEAVAGMPPGCGAGLPEAV
jgi:tetratricopeptide (TPR) repeat protein